MITDLKWPASLSNDRKAVMTNSLMGISKAAAQKLLDEVAGNMERNTVKTTPERLLSALVRRFRCGKFAPDAGLAVRMRRERAVNQPPPVAKEPVRPASPETIRAELAKIDKILGLGRSRGVAEE